LTALLGQELLMKVEAGSCHRSTLDQQGRLYLPARIARRFGARALEIIIGIARSPVLLTAGEL
jgi:bifunctional DNA-binding transcriptional regulator/antitoxin component of YhaV-PrlF toxin-antitoxin module